MRVCVVGSGGREHALAAALARTATVVVTPGNAGITTLAGDLPITCSSDAPEEIDADLWVIGPEQPLVGGLADRLRASGRPTLGPGAEGARLEGSKKWMKEVLVAAGVPTAAHEAFTSPDAAEAYLRGMRPPYVVKTDGLAAGKGVLVTESLPEAIADVREKLAGRLFGDAGRAVVIEEGLAGPELSVMALCDGIRAVPLAAAQDFKRAGDGDTGANTGGMGAYSPVPVATPEVVEEVMTRAVRPTLAALAASGIDYRGVLYAGVMLTEAGPRILEFNVRFGDPETQVVLPRWQGDVAEVLLAAAEGRLDTVPAPTFPDDLAAVCVVLAAAGYPASPRLGDPVAGVAGALAREGVSVFAAGLAAAPHTDGLVTAGGRVLGVTALAPTLAGARALAYDAAGEVSAPGLWCRSDIALAASTPTPRPPDYEEARP
ncbi:MAG: phosphoribosylamine--glycine ligase [Acidimicrobiaceae bacterium]|nr:phosphoribosylamine--glycine ligase [Acidimicrobiaceae bacterium]